MSNILNMAKSAKLPAGAKREVNGALVIIFKQGGSSVILQHSPIRDAELRVTWTSANGSSFSRDFSSGSVAGVSVDASAKAQPYSHRPSPAVRERQLVL